MTHKEMRQELKQAGITVPVSNKDVEEKYKEVFSGKENIVSLASKNIYTYIGMGDTPPERINFMGRQKFRRGDSTEVTDPIVLNKVKDNPCFVLGEVEQEVIHDNDEKAAKKAQAQRDRDVELQIVADRANR